MKIWTPFKMLSGNCHYHAMCPKIATFTITNNGYSWLAVKNGEWRNMFAELPASMEGRSKHGLVGAKLGAIIDFLRMRPYDYIQKANLSYGDRSTIVEWLGAYVVDLEHNLAETGLLREEEKFKKSVLDPIAALQKQCYIADYTPVQSQSRGCHYHGGRVETFPEYVKEISELEKVNSSSNALNGDLSCIACKGPRTHVSTEMCSTCLVEQAKPKPEYNPDDHIAACKNKMRQNKLFMGSSYGKFGTYGNDNLKAEARKIKRAARHAGIEESQRLHNQLVGGPIRK